MLIIQKNPAATTTSSSDPNLMIMPPLPKWFTPAQIRHAYGFDQVGLNGAGQTIAIVDAFNNPTIRQDLNVFNAQFGLPPVDLTVVNQNGGSNPPAAVDFGWAGETALDVEWAHAIAPLAKIVLVQTRNNVTENLMAGANYARSLPGVSVVSMSWGAIERIAETAAEINNNKVFTTPAGHQGITFVASSGDATDTPVSFPGSSANVLSVGGTALVAPGGNYASETSWWDGFGGGSTGGFSNIEAVPYYQKPVISSEAFLGINGVARRAVPDVSLNADPATGFAFYDATSAGDPDFGWQNVGGTSVSAPIWAALVALANQQRVAGGKGTLDGFHETLPALYKTYSNPGTPGYATYTANFHDIDDIISVNPNPALPGYDTITGLGTPKVAQVFQTLFNATPAVDTTGPTPVTYVPQVSTFITGQVTSPMPQFTNPGDRVKLKTLLTNVTGGRYRGPVIINVYASTSSTLPPNATPIASISMKKLNLRAGRSKKMTLKFDFPNNLGSGDYFYFISPDTSAVSTPVV